MGPVERVVSIRARHCWRAFPKDFDDQLKANKFQSAPAIAGGRFKECKGAYSVINQFQSAPAIAGGRFAPRA